MFWTVDVLGNLLGLQRASNDSSLETVARDAVRREAGAADVSDGIAAYSVRPAALDFAFCNPDGSAEQLCGNALLALGVLTRPAQPLATAIHTPLIGSIAVSCRGDRAALDITLQPSTLLRNSTTSTVSTGLGAAVLIDAGTPHLVIESQDVNGISLGDARRLADSLNTNVTLYTLTNGTVQARTLERGMTHETDSCGSGAFSIGLVVSSNQVGRWNIAFRGGDYLFERTGDGTTTRLSVAASSVQITRVQVLHPSPSCESSSSIATAPGPPLRPTKSVPRSSNTVTS